MHPHLVEEGRAVRLVLRTVREVGLGIPVWVWVKGKVVQYETYGQSSHHDESVRHAL